MSGEDWVEVQLTAFGEQYVKANGGGPLRIHDGNREFDFVPGQPLRVTKAYDWERVLRPQHVNGTPLFHIVGRVLRPQPSPGPGIFQRDDKKTTAEGGGGTQATEEKK